MSVVLNNPSFHWDKPVYIVGNPRSGTSLLRIMLHNHSQLCIPPESHFFLWLEDRYKNWDLSLLDSYLIDLYNSTKFETWQIVKENLKLFIIEENPNSYAQLNSLVYFFFNKDKSKNISYWGDKNKLWKEKLPNVRRYYPNAYYIHLIRDGRDVACSFKDLGAKKMTSKYAPKLPTEINEIAKKWAQNISFITEFQKTVLPSNTITIRYEDLLQRPDIELTRVCGLLRINFEPAMLSYYQQDKANIEPSEFYEWKEKLTSPPDLDNIGKYKTQLTEAEIDIFNKIAQKELSTYNYAL